MVRTVNEKELNKMIKQIKGAKCVLLETDKGTSLFGDIRDLLALYAEIAEHLKEKSGLPTECILEACKLGLGMDNMYEKAEGLKDLEKIDKEIDKELDKKLETIEKLMGILKDLRKGDR